MHDLGIRWRAKGAHNIETLLKESMAQIRLVF
jgi:hypothetical protein